jgi:lipoprotein NlpD
MMAIGSQRHPPYRIALIVIAMASMLAACGKSHVIRDTGHRDRPVASKPANRAAKRQASRPKAGTSVQVRKGDTLYRIATENGVSPLDLAVWNRIPPPYTIYPGQRLRLSPSTERPTAPRPPASSSKPPVATTTKPTGATPPSTTNSAPARDPKPSEAVAVATAPPQAAFAWRWPADGAIVGRYSVGDPTKQGIDISGQSGAPVRAAADGVVVYSGAGLVGYGELIIVKHSEQWLSAYGHNRARLVNEGQRVKAGERIAEMGRSGASRDMLHFEIRYNGKPQDPLAYLPKK